MLRQQKQTSDRQSIGDNDYSALREKRSSPELTSRPRIKEDLAAQVIIDQQRYLTNSQHHSDIKK